MTRIIEDDDLDEERERFRATHHSPSQKERNLRRLAEARAVLNQGTKENV